MPESMPHADLWRRELSTQLDPRRAADLLTRVEARYAELYRGRTHYDHPALRDHLAKSFLPWGNVASNVTGRAPCCTIVQDRLE